MPMPMPPAGGMPSTSATRKSSSSFCCLAAGLVFQPLALLNGIVLLGVGGRDFLAVYAALEDLDGRRVVG